MCPAQDYDSKATDLVYCWQLFHQFTNQTYSFRLPTMHGIRICLPENYIDLEQFLLSFQVYYLAICHHHPASIIPPCLHHSHCCRTYITPPFFPSSFQLYYPATTSCHCPITSIQVILSCCLPLLPLLHLYSPTVAITFTPLSPSLSSLLHHLAITTAFVPVMYIIQVQPCPPLSSHPGLHIWLSLLVLPPSVCSTQSHQA